MTTKSHQSRSRSRAAWLRSWRFCARLWPWQALALSIFGVVILLANAVEASQAVVELTQFSVIPETLTVNQGDTVVFVWNDSSSGATASYTGEWSSPILTTGQTFSYTFTDPGDYVYHSSRPGVIRVQPVTNNYPAVWIARPLNQFIVPGYADVEAATTNPPDMVQAVNFYADGQFVGRVTNPPYVLRVAPTPSSLPVTYDLTARVIDTQGQANASAAVRVTFAHGDPPQLFHAWRLPHGETVLYVSAIPVWCPKWSADLLAWNGQTYQQRLGKSIIVDEGTTNVTQRFYYVVPCLSAFSDSEWLSALNNAGFPLISSPISAAPP